ncbi:unnamed protein product [Moneuplotes crassus]|uniref:Uncharacterized protein n=1 Tax=Euplotes crassus TaxID=5936 RepID=A0AAD1XCM0_EUPCR|nr:unnamed protein product [Moneuplotes crassus]
MFDPKVFFSPKKFKDVGKEKEYLMKRYQARNNFMKKENNLPNLAEKVPSEILRNKDAKNIKSILKMIKGNQEKRQTEYHSLMNRTTSSRTSKMRTLQSPFAKSHKNTNLHNARTLSQFERIPSKAKSKQRKVLASSLPKLNSMFPSATEVKTGFQKFYFINNNSPEQFVLHNDKVKIQNPAEYSRNHTMFLKNLSMNSKFMRRSEHLNAKKNTLNINLPSADQVELIEKKRRQNEECDIVILPGKAVELTHKRKIIKSPQFNTERNIESKESSVSPVKIKQKVKPAMSKMKVVKTSRQSGINFHRSKATPRKKNIRQDSPVNFQKRKESSHQPEKSKQVVNKDIYEDFGNKFLSDLPS